LFPFLLGALAGVVVVRDMLQPINRRAVELFLDRDMAHRRGRRRAMPMPFAGLEPDDIAGADFLDRLALTLDEPAAGSDDQCLTGLGQFPRSAGVSR
jgi:hypothetical protein